MIVIDTDSIKLKYGSLAEFTREESIDEGVFFGLLKKKSISFQKGSKAWKAFKQIQNLGFVKINKEEIA
ncbi:MAG: hypothetical protein EOM50_15935 [Erysipelotrichia bacterium]|nr:hypothetical protein [Erysipelotrichia bacterium]